MGKHYSYTDQYLGCALALLRQCIGTPAASSQFFFLGVMTEENFTRHFEGYRGGLCRCSWTSFFFFFSKQEEKRKLRVDETSRKWVGEAVVMSCCLWQ